MLLEGEDFFDVFDEQSWDELRQFLLEHPFSDRDVWDRCIQYQLALGSKLAVPFRLFLELPYERLQKIQNIVEWYATEMARRLDCNGLSTNHEESPKIVYEKLASYEEPYAYISEEVWDAWVEKVRRRGCEYTTVTEIADRLKLYWPRGLPLRVSSLLDFSLHELLSLRGGKRKQRTMFLVVAYLVTGERNSGEL